MYRHSLSFVVFCIACLVYLSACLSSAIADGQAGDDQWVPSVASPAYPAGDGPLVLVDAGHGNFHTIDGRYSAFADLLRLDGFRVRSTETRVTPETLDQASILVISNALLGGDDAEWSLPTPAAFTEDEIEVIADWVDSGGSLLLIADHMPFPGATATLAEKFGFTFYNGFAMKSATAGGVLTFTRSSGALVDHAITRGRTASERIESLTSFTGQAFGFSGEVQPLMHMPDDWKVFLPSEAWDFDESTPRVSASGLIQGGVVERGVGRVAVFGEAAMFTAQVSIRNGKVRRMGMSHPAASENAQFVLNVMRWLSRRIPD